MSKRAMISRLTAVFVLLTASTISAGQDNKKLEYAILVDSTGSMRSQFEVVLNLARGVVHQIHDRGPVSIYRFRSDSGGRPVRAVPTAVIEREQNEKILERAIDDIYIEGGQTTLLDAIELMEDRFKQPPEATEKIIVLITDGEDRVSHMTQQELTRKLTSNKTTIYAVGLVQQLEGSKRSKAIGLLSSLAKDTGGRAVFPKSDKIDMQSLLTELALPIQ